MNPLCAILRKNPQEFTKNLPMKRQSADELLRLTLLRLVWWNRTLRFAR
jgi:hypothetical protein